MPFRRMGPNSHRDDFAVAFDLKTARQRVKDLADNQMSDDEVIRRYNLKETATWKLSEVRANDLASFEPTECFYRPFDFRFMLRAEWAYDRLGPELLKHLVHGQPALLALKQADEGFAVFVTDKCVGQHKLTCRYDGSYVIPLYLFPTNEELQLDQRKANFESLFISSFSSKLGLQFIADGNGDLDKTFGPVDVLNYAYAVFYSPTYRARYAELLRNGFPRLPLTASKSIFQALVEKGAELVALHLMKSPLLQHVSPAFPVKGSNTIEVAQYSESGQRVLINSTQYFDNVPKSAWEFIIGGYQMAERWLNERTGRKLTFDDMLHYQKLVVAQTETIRIMSQIDALIPRWPLE